MKKRFAYLLLLPCVLLASCNSQVGTKTPSEVEKTPTQAEKTPTPVEKTPTAPANAFSITTAYEANKYTYDETTKTYTITEISANEEECIFVLKGNLEGQIVCADSLTTKVQFTLDNCNITSTQACITWSAESSKVIIKSKNGTTNSLTTNCENVSTVVSNNNVEITGKGSLTITNTGDNCIDCSNLEVEETTLTLVANTKNGVSAKEIEINSGNINIKAVKSCLKAELNKKNKKGTIAVNGGVLVLEGQYAFSADTSVTLTKAVAEVELTVSIKGSTTLSKNDNLTKTIEVATIA